MLAPDEKLERISFIRGQRELDRVAGSGSAEDAIVPFNVLETSTAELLKAFNWFLQTDPLSALRVSLREWLQNDDVFLTASGECGIAQVLACLPQPEVVMPAWICHKVIAAARIAGKRIVFIDLAPNNINSTSAEYAAAAQPGRILLIAHLFGVPTDVAGICRLAKERDCVTIEDAVAAIGGRQHGRLLGTFADFGVFSFEHSKRIPAFRGGFIVVNNKTLGDQMQFKPKPIVKTTRAMPYLPLAKALVQNVITGPWIYRTLTRRLLGLRELSGGRPKPARPGTLPVDYGRAAIRAIQTPFYTKELHPYQAQVLLPVIRRMDAIGQKISVLARIYEERLKNTRVQTFVPAAADKSGLMRFPIALPGRNRSDVLRLAEQRGVYLKAMWSEDVYDGLPNCRWAARNLIMLPLYTALAPNSAARIADTVLEIDGMLAA